METEREMTERMIKEAEYAFKRNLKYIIGFLFLIVVLIWIFLKIF